MTGIPASTAVDTPRPNGLCHDWPGDQVADQAAPPSRWLARLRAGRAGGSGRGRAIPTMEKGREHALSEGRDGLSTLRYGRSALIMTKWETAMAEGDQEKRREAARKAAAAKSPQARREAAFKGAAKRSHEERSEASRKAAAAKSPEVRREAALKAAATRKRNREA